MKLRPSDLREITEMLKHTEQFKPLIKDVVNLIQEYAAELSPLLNSFREHMVDQKIRSIRQFSEAGFTKEEAMFLTNSLFENFYTSIQNSRSRAQKK